MGWKMSYSDYWLSLNRERCEVRSNNRDIVEIVDSLGRNGFGMLPKSIGNLSSEFRDEYCSSCNNNTPVYGHSLYKTKIGKMIYDITERVRRMMWEMGHKIDYRSQLKNNQKILNDGKTDPIAEFLFNHQYDLQRLFFSKNAGNGHCQRNAISLLGRCVNYMDEKGKFPFR